VADHGVTLLRHLHDGVRAGRRDRRSGGIAAAARAFMAGVAGLRDRAHCARFCARRVHPSALRTGQGARRTPIARCCWGECWHAGKSPMKVCVRNC